LSVPWWWWPTGLAVIAVFEFSVRLGHPGVPAWVPVLVMVPLMVTALLRLGRVRITLTEERDGNQVLRVGPAQLPTRFIADAVPVPARDKQVMLGPELDPLAYVMHRPWIGAMVRVTLNDPADPTPYWIFSARHPEALVRCLRGGHSG
jgi:hypothetical protein